MTVVACDKALYVIVASSNGSVEPAHLCSLAIVFSLIAYIMYRSSLMFDYSLEWLT